MQDSSMILPLLLAMATIPQALPEWEDQNIVGVNKEQPRATSRPLEDLKTALKGRTFPVDRVDAAPHKLYELKYVRSLNGDSKLNWVTKQAERPMDFFKAGFDDSSWKT